jgi:drug/metabolite transporter (DMT)-like permease
LPPVDRYEWLLFLHVTGAFAVVATVVLYGAVVVGGVGAPMELRRRFLQLGNVLFSIGAVLTLVFGVWLAIDDDQYELWDGWIIAALVLWVIAGAVEQRFRRSLAPPADVDTATRARDATLMYGVLAAVVVAFLLLMITKPGA